ncbi:MAG: type II secretion system protein M [Bermanella sp.]
MAEFIERFKEQSKQQLMASGIYQGALSWFDGLTSRDQLMVKSISMAIFLALIFIWIWQPSQVAKHKSEQRFNSELTFHNKMKENAFHFGVANKNPSSSKGGSILGVVNNTAKAKNITLKRFEPEGQQGLRVWLDSANFNSVIDWLEILETQKGISIEQISIDKVSPGLVNLRAVLKS